MNPETELGVRQRGEAGEKCSQVRHSARARRTAGQPAKGHCTSEFVPVCLLQRKIAVWSLFGELKLAQWRLYLDRAAARGQLLAYDTRCGHSAPENKHRMMDDKRVEGLVYGILLQLKLSKSKTTLPTLFCKDVTQAVSQVKLLLYINCSSL